MGLHAFASILTDFGSSCIIVKEVGANEENADGCSGNAEIGSQRSRVAGARGAFAEAPRRADPSAVARAARDGAEPRGWAAEPAGGERVGPAHARVAAGPGDAVRGGVQADEIERPVPTGGIRERATGDDRRAAAADHPERSDPGAGAELHADRAVVHGRDLPGAGLAAATQRGSYGYAR